MRRPSLQFIIVKYSILSSLIVAVVATIVYMQYTHTDYIDFLWRMKAGYIPVSLLLILGSVVFGAVIGQIIHFYLSAPLRKLSRALLEVERGNYIPTNDDGVYQEFAGILSRFSTLTDKFATQAANFQNKTNERANEEEMLLEQAISGERSRIARELHDSVSQQLFAISMTSSALNEMTEDEHPMKKQIRLIEDVSIQAQGEMRALLLQLRPIQLDGKRLVQGIEELLRDLSAKQQIKLISHIDDITLTRGVEDHLFRILQEAISNTLRHANAKKIEVRLRKIEPFAILKVIDDGIGFDTKENKIGSYGLQTMRERVEEIGGTLKVISLQNVGTTVEVKVPLQVQDEEKEGESID